MLIVNRIIKFFRCLFFGKKDEQIKEIKYENYSLSQFDFEIIDLINQYRESKNLSRLFYAPAIVNNICFSHILWLQKNVTNGGDFSVKGHYYSQTRFDQIQLRFPNCSNIGENVGYNYRTANSVVDAWVNSDSHRGTLEGDYTHLGVASAEKFTETLFIKLK